MAQFDLYHLNDGQLVVDLQTDLIGIEASRVVAPLREAGQYVAFPGLTPSVELDGKAWIVRVQELAAVTGAELGEPVEPLGNHRDTLKRAQDMTGSEDDQPWFTRSLSLNGSKQQKDLPLLS